MAASEEAAELVALELRRHLELQRERYTEHTDRDLLILIVGTQEVMLAKLAELGKLMELMEIVDAIKSNPLMAAMVGVDEE